MPIEMDIGARAGLHGVVDVLWIGKHHFGQETMAGWLVCNTPCVALDYLQHDQCCKHMCGGKGYVRHTIKD